MHESKADRDCEDIKSTMRIEAYNIIAFNKFGISYSDLLDNINKFNKVGEYGEMSSYYNADGTKKKLKLNQDKWFGVVALSVLVSMPFMPLLLVNNIFIKLFTVVAIIFIFYLSWSCFTAVPCEYRFKKQQIKDYFEDKNKLDILRAQQMEIFETYNESSNLQSNPL